MFCVQRSLIIATCDVVSPMWYCATHVILCHPCDIVPPMWCCFTHVILCHPCDVVSPMWCCATHVIWCHPCDVVPPMWYCATHVILCHPCDIVPPMKNTSLWLTLELVRIVVFCCVWGFCSLNTKSWQGGQPAHAAWGLLVQCVKLPRFRLVTYCLILAVLSYFSLHFKKLNNAYLQQEFK